ncbi:MAG TPA: DUF222 domain-containing protein [Trebonia sp.]|nr:DUF222 domain-containing protein [Trebonia sp.]
MASSSTTKRQSLVNESDQGESPRDRDPRWSMFAQESRGDRIRPDAWQVMILDDLSAPDGRCTGATDDEVFGVLGQWNAAACWVEGRKLAVVRELIRRRPDERNVGTATESGLPWDWDDRLAREIALELHVSVPAARKLTWTAWALEARLPGVGKALEEGRLDSGKARMIVQETDVLLDAPELAAAERLIMDGLPDCNTWLELQRLVQRAVVAVDPQGAEKRREQEEKENARVRFWREAAGTCALMGAGLPTDEALRAHAHVDQRAQEYRAAGIKRGIDILRVAAYLDLLNLVPAADRIARFKAEDAAVAADDGQQGSTQAQQESQAAATPGPGATQGDNASTDFGGPASGGTSTDFGGPASTDCGTAALSPDPGPAVAAEVNLTLRHLDIPFATAAGFARRAGEARSLGVLDPGLARRLAEAAARHPESKFCLTIVNGTGQAIGHGCCKPGKPRESGGADAFILRPGDATGPPGGFGSWILTLPGQARELAVDLHPVPTGECEHRYESSRHDPGGLLRHLVNVRDGKCGFPACSRHAKESDFEHAEPFEHGGRTCGCNCWSCSRSCHQVKQSAGWTVTEAEPGYHRWTTPSGRQYTQEPWRYPA